MSDSKVLTWKLSGRGAELARELNENVDEMKREMDALSAEFQERAEGLQGKYKILNLSLWTELMRELGVDVDPEQTFKSPQWRLDVSYLENHGDAYVQKYPEDKKPGKTMDDMSAYVVGSNGGGLPN